MSSDDVATTRLSTEMMARCIRRAHVDELARWTEAPWIDYDIGAQTVRDGVFGKLALPVVHDGEVLYHPRIVEAERMEPKDNGELMVLDLSPLGWPRNRALAAVLGEDTAEATRSVDRALLAELVTGIAQEDLSLLEAAGWDGDQVDDIIAELDADDEGLFGDDDDRCCPHCGLPLSGGQ